VQQIKIQDGEDEEAYPCKWALCQEGIPLIAPHMTRRVITFSCIDDFTNLMAAGRLSNDEIVEAGAARRIRGLETCKDAGGALVPGGAMAVLGGGTVCASCAIRVDGSIDVSLRRQEREGIVTLLGSQSAKEGKGTLHQ
jgi:hypothetical protein